MSKYKEMIAAGGTPPQRVTKERFWFLLECLPPLKWVRERGAESFAILEPDIANLHTHCVRIGERYYEFLCPISTTHRDLVEIVKPSHYAQGAEVAAPSQ
jgi:hypothetical protein